MSWKNNNASPEERPLHYIGHRPLHKIMSFTHMKKVIRRQDTVLWGSAHTVCTFNCHIWSSNTFTIVFLETGHMGASKRNAVDKASLVIGTRIAAGRALSAFMATWDLEEKELAAGRKGEDLRDQVIPMARKHIPQVLAKIKRDEAVAEERAKQSLIHRDGMNIPKIIGSRFCF